jgi:uncharacterized protein YciW
MDNEKQRIEQLAVDLQASVDQWRANIEQARQPYQHAAQRWFDAGRPNAGELFDLQQKAFDEYMAAVDAATAARVQREGELCGCYLAALAQADDVAVLGFDRDGTFRDEAAD